jgi:hypothetical protein
MSAVLDKFGNPHIVRSTRSNTNEYIFVNKSPEEHKEGLQTLLRRLAPRSAGAEKTKSQRPGLTRKRWQEVVRSKERGCPAA